MKKDPQATANALAVVGGAWYALCVVWIAVSKASYMGIMGTWFHGVDYGALPSAPLTINSALVGLVSFVAFAWISGYFFAVVYNYFVKK